MVHWNDPKHEIFRFDIQSEMATETEFKTLVSVETIYYIITNVFSCQKNMTSLNMLP